MTARPDVPRERVLDEATEHCLVLEAALARLRTRQLPLLTGWGEVLAELLPGGGRLLAAGNGGSAAQAQHLTAELVGRYFEERPAFSAISLHAETSSVTAIGNDYGFDELYARQVAAHGRSGDVLVLMSTSGRSPNLLRAASAARTLGMRVWGMTGPRPNPLAQDADEALCVDADRGATVQEAHLVALHLMCEALDAALARRGGDGRTSSTTGVLHLGARRPGPRHPGPRPRRESR
ncbi:D-sedoheptulose-7-phosphate isomerase [Wenjunlia tyrosinilytica]|uniref:Phosphoheptose isomerase n=1 Tax=Wenjunlia tyrosinilytica TaxID=1544741 RepID=A0A917ZK48_9ACTN|nr:SIS domain-containing protein [Wenjunlia tyrosinilytica]GGO84702.1 phosphoheptose isomerase [Wenjunlia tyrosinilytica]